MSVVTRFPPSPTGYFHIGSARTALFNYLFAAHAGGEMRVRFEDTDKARNKKEFEDDILAGLRWLGISFDEAGIIHQSERTDLYKGYIAKLIVSGDAYVAESSTEEPGKKVVRFKNPNVRIEFQDLIRGTMSFDTSELKDFVIAKSINEPLYNLAVVIDDHETGVTHVVRGEDHISNTPRQILVLEALGFTRPQYAHIPLILAPDRSKMSKRHGAVSLNEYREQGIIPEAMVNYLALLGWNPGGEQELFSLKELVSLFDISRVHKGGAIFDMEKLIWFNHQHLQRLSDSEYIERLGSFTKHEVDPAAIPLLKERARTLKEAAELLEGEFAFLKDIHYEPTLLLQGGKIEKDVASEHMRALSAMLIPLQETEFSAERVKEIIWSYATEKGRGAVLWPLRTALSGREKSPDPFIIASLIGKNKTLERIDAALAGLGSI